MTSGLAPLAVAVPLVAAALCSIFGSRLPRIALCLLSLAAAAFATVACARLAQAAAAHGPILHWFGGWQPRHGVALGIAFVVDTASGALAAFAGLLTMAALLFAWTFFKDDDGAFHALMLVFNAALIGFFLTGDLFNLFVFFELMSVSAYALTGYKSEDASAVQGAFSFAIVNSTGAFLGLSGVALIYARTGALNMAQIAHALGGTGDALVVMAFALIALGFLVKAAIVPFHFWLSEAHAVAPTPVCVLFSGVMVAAGLYAVARVYWSIFSGALAAHQSGVGGVLLGLGVLTALVGAVMCYAQRHLKRLLAFSTIAHSGIMLCAIALLRSDALAGFFVYLLGHGLLKGGLFMSSGIVLNRYRTLDVEELRGKLRDVPWLVVAFCLGALGLAGLPPFGTFLGKALIDRAATEARLAWLALVLLFAAALTGAALLNAVGRMAFGWGPPPDPGAIVPRDEAPETDPATGRRLVVMAVPALALLALACGTGTFEGVASTASAAAHWFVDLRGQEANVLASHPVAPLGPVVPAGIAAGIGIGFWSAALAVALAAGGLFAHRLPLWPTLKRAYEAAMHVPHAWHSGIVTDYVAWLVTGSALFGSALLVFTR
jgi:multicomponent Na+:H+ antiporter subunit D